MTPEDSRQLLLELRDTNRQLVEAQQQIAQSFGRIESMWTGQMKMMKYAWVFGLIPFLLLIPLFWSIWSK